MMRLWWTPEAIQDREAIYEHVEADKPRAALKLDEMFEQRAASLVDHPGLGKRGRVEGTRELVVHENYVLVYDVEGDQVRILRVLHAARQWPSQE